MKIIKLIVVLFCCGVVAQVQAADSAVAKGKVKRGMPLEKDVITQLLIADQLAALGEAGQDPLSYLMAARIQKALRIRNAEGSQESDQSRFRYFMARAKELSAGDATYKGIIDELESSALVSRGPVSSNIKQQRLSLAPGAIKSYALSFKGGEEAQAVLLLDLPQAGEGRRAEIDLDMYVLDEAKRTVCAMEGPGVPELCSWTPETTGKFEIQIKNVGRVEAPYVLNFR